MSEPTTEAGRRLLAWYGDERSLDVRDFILAIEQEAREKGMAEGIHMAQQRAWEDTPHIQAKARADIAARIEQRVKMTVPLPSDRALRDAILDAIREASDDRRA